MFWFGVLMRLLIVLLNTAGSWCCLETYFGVETMSALWVLTRFICFGLGLDAYFWCMVAFMSFTV